MAREGNGLGKRIENIRLNKGMNKTEFGKLFGASGSLVNKWENHGIVPSEERLKQLAKIGDYESVEQLLYGEFRERIMPVFDEVVEEIEQEFNTEEFKKIIKNKEKIINDNKAILEYLLYNSSDENAISSMIESSIRSYLFERKDINEHLLSVTTFQLDDLREELYSLVVDGYSVNKQNINRDYVRGVYVYDSIENFKDEVNEDIYEQVDSILKKAYTDINTIYKTYYEDEFKDFDWLKLRNYTLRLLSDEQFRKYSFYVNEIISTEKYSNIIDDVLSTMIPNLEHIKYNISSIELRDAIVSFLNDLEVPANWEVPIKRK